MCMACVEGTIEQGLHCTTINQLKVAKFSHNRWLVNTLGQQARDLFLVAHLRCRPLLFPYLPHPTLLTFSLPLPPLLARQS